MSKRPRRKFETGFKKQLVAQIEAGQITATEAARTHSISPTVISYWRKQFQAGELSEGPTRREKALEKEKKDADIKDLIDDIHTDFPYYGYRLLHEELKRRGHSVNTKKIRRLQRKFGLFPVCLRKFVRTTDSKHSHSNLSGMRRVN